MVQVVEFKQSREVGDVIEMRSGQYVVSSVKNNTFKVVPIKRWKAFQMAKRVFEFFLISLTLVALCSLAWAMVKSLQYDYYGDGDEETFNILGTEVDPYIREAHRLQELRLGHA